MLNFSSNYATPSSIGPRSPKLTIMILPNHEVTGDISSQAYQKALTFFDDLVGLSPETNAEVIDRIKVVLYKPKDIILRYGEVCNWSFFCFSGLAMATVQTETEEKVVRFFRSGEIMVSFDSWLGQKPSLEQFTALRETVGVGLPYKNWQQLIHRADFQQMYVKLIELVLRETDEHAKWKQYSPQEKFLYLAEVFPDLLTEVPDVYLSNYIGVSRRTFSAMKSKRWKK